MSSLIVRYCSRCGHIENVQEDHRHYLDCCTANERNTLPLHLARNARLGLELELLIAKDGLLFGAMKRLKEEA